jgi:uncharacterized protein (TIGR00255 family)
MVNSMTAFAREADDSGPGSLVVEIRSVNHRYLDCIFKLPEALRGLEPAWRQRLQKTLSRGKLECQVRYQVSDTSTDEMEVDLEALRQLARASDTVTEHMPGCGQPTSLEVLLWPGVVAATTEGESSLEQRANALFDRALENLAESRSREGARLAEFIGDRLLQVEGEVERTRKLMPELLSHQRQKLEQRVEELKVDVEPGRLEQELVLLAQKADVDEELDRLETHVEEVGRVLKKGGPCGRRLDFLMQELNREANTLSSKSISGSTTQNAVELKVLIEQMREQIQNLE